MTQIQIPMGLEQSITPTEDGKPPADPANPTTYAEALAASNKRLTDTQAKLTQTSQELAALRGDPASDPNSANDPGLQNTNDPTINQNLPQQLTLDAPVIDVVDFNVGSIEDEVRSTGAISEASIKSFKTAMSSGKLSETQVDNIVSKFTDAITVLNDTATRRGAEILGDTKWEDLLGWAGTHQDKTIWNKGLKSDGWEAVLGHMLTQYKLAGGAKVPVNEPSNPLTPGGGGPAGVGSDLFANRAEVTTYYNTNHEKIRTDMNFRRAYENKLMRSRAVWIK